LEKLKLRGIILCEGNEKWFLDEIVGRLGIPSKIVNEFNKLQGIIKTLSRGRPVENPNPEIFTHPLHPPSRDKEYLYRLIVRRTPYFYEPAKYFKVVRILVILDENCEGLDKKVEKFVEMVNKELIEKSRGTKPKVEIETNVVHISLKKYKIQYEFFVIPKSYEIQLFKKFKDKYPNLLNSVHEEDKGINIVCMKFFDCNKEVLHRSAVELFKDEEWFKRLVEILNC